MPGEARRYKSVSAWEGAIRRQHSFVCDWSAWRKVQRHSSQRCSRSPVYSVVAQTQLGLSAQHEAVGHGDVHGRALERQAGSWNPLDMCGWPPSSDAVSLPFRITMNGYPAALPLSNQIKVNCLVKTRVWVGFICYLIRVSGSGLPSA